jgi:thiol:disulfide interchange protein DsbD
MKKIGISILLCLMLVGFNVLSAQAPKVVKWEVTKGAIDDDVVEIHINAEIDNKWKLYSQHTADGGPVPTSFTFFPSDSYELVGEVKELSDAIVNHDELFEIEVTSFVKSADFVQKVKLKDGKSIIKGEIRYMTCNGHQCLPPQDIPFEIKI